MQGYISPAQTCALIILGCGEDHVRGRKMWTEDTITEAKQLILKMGITFGACEHCEDFWWLYKVTCSCGRKNRHGLRGCTCEKRLCGRCYQLYPPSNLRKLVKYAEKESVPLVGYDFLGSYTTQNGNGGEKLARRTQADSLV